MLKAWKKVSLAEIGNTYNGLTGLNLSNFGDGDKKYITFLNILNNPIVNINKFERFHCENPQNEVKKGDLFFNTSSETPEEVAMCSTINDDVKDLYLNSFCFGYRLNNTQINNVFLSYLFRSNIGRNIIKSIAQGSTRFNLPKGKFLEYEFYIPESYEEQKAIADVLTNIDELIHSLEKLIEKKEKIKNGVKIKYIYGTEKIDKYKNSLWMRVEVKQIFNIGRGRVISHKEIDSTTSNSYPVYSSQTTNDGIMGYLNTYDFSGDYITWTTDGANAGKVFYRSGKFNCTNVCGTLKLMDESKFDYRFLAYLLDLECKKHVSTNLANPKLMNNVMGKVAINVPVNVQEQREIADILSNMDNEIDEIKKKLEKYKKIKEGMMEDLLTGKVRLEHE